MKEIIKEQRLLGITLLFVCLLNTPILSIFNKLAFIGGIPILYFYVFLVWLMMIILVAWIVEKNRKSSDGTLDE